MAPYLVQPEPLRISRLSPSEKSILIPVEYGMEMRNYPGIMTMSKYYPPVYGSQSFHCPICNVYAKQGWRRLLFQGTGSASPFKYSTCEHCNKVSYWYKERLIIPGEAPVPPHHEDLPDSCKEDYNEARDVSGRSPKAAAALMRLVVQKLLVELGQTGKNLNDDIGALVKSGMPVEVQEALDFCRVIGNNAVHPGDIKIDDDPSISYSLFEMVNFIVEDRISRPKKIAELYGKLPPGALKAVEERDSKSGAG